MAIEQVHQGNNIHNQAPAMLPPYPEMIMTAVEALNGSNKSSISKQIEATYGNLPPAHSTLLTHHLNKMKSTGQLQFIKNNYLKPDPNAPPRRGRGRPPKPKNPGAVSPLSRPRGRPPKSTSPLPPPEPKSPTKTATVSGKKRGRPPKAIKADVVAPVPPPAGGAPRGRGRPPKVKSPISATVGA